MIRTKKSRKISAITKRLLPDVLYEGGEIRPERVINWEIQRARSKKLRKEKN